MVNEFKDIDIDEIMKLLENEPNKYSDGSSYTIDEINEIDSRLRYGTWYDCYLKSRDRFQEFLDAGRFDELEYAQSVYYIDGEFILASDDEDMRKVLVEERCEFGRKGYPRPKSSSGRVFESVKSYKCILLSACERITGTEYLDWRKAYKDTYGYADVYNYVKNGNKKPLIYFWLDEVDNINAINNGKTDCGDNEYTLISGDLRTSCGEITLEDSTLTIVTKNSIYKFNVIQESRIFPYRKVFHHPFHKS